MQNTNLRSKRRCCKNVVKFWGNFFSRGKLFWKIFGNFGKFWKISKNFGKFWKISGKFFPEISPKFPEIVKNVPLGTALKFKSHFWRNNTAGKLDRNFGKFREISRKLFLQNFAKFYKICKFWKFRKFFFQNWKIPEKSNFT